MHASAILLGALEETHRSTWNICVLWTLAFWGALLLCTWDSWWVLPSLSFWCTCALCWGGGSKWSCAGVSAVRGSLQEVISGENSMHEVHMEGWPSLSRPCVHRHGRAPRVSPSRSRTLGRADCAVAPAYGGHAQFHPGFTITESLFMKYQGWWERFSVGQASEGEFFLFVHGT